MPHPIPSLETERLLLRPFTFEDATDMQRLAGHEKIASTTLNVPHPYEVGMAEQWIATHAKDYFAQGSINHALCLKQTGELIGAIGLAIQKRHNRAELGYWIGVPYWNQGYCTEAARCLIRFGFESMSLHKITSCHLHDNPASGRVMLKVGMEFEGELKDQIRKGDAYMTVRVYGILNPKP